MGFPSPGTGAQLNHLTPRPIKGLFGDNYLSITDLDFTNLKGEKIRGVEVQDATISGNNLILTFDAGSVTEDIKGVKSKKIITDEKIIDLNDKKEINSVLGDYLKSIYGSDATVDKAIFNLRSKQEDIKTIVAYRGAVATLKAKFSKGIKNKKAFFKEGSELLEFAVTSEPKNIEIRCLRLGVQENSPKIVGYKQHIEADKQFILNHYASVTDGGLRKFIKGYVVLSSAFTDAEKQLF